MGGKSVVVVVSPGDVVVGETVVVVGQTVVVVEPSGIVLEGGGARCFQRLSSYDNDADPEHQGVDG